MFDRIRSYLRDAIDLRRTRTSIALSEARLRQQQLTLAESTRTGISYAYGDLVDRRDDWNDFDGYGWPWSNQDRRDGQNAPFIQSETDLAEIRGLARWIAEENPIAIGILEDFTSFAVGDGLTYRAGPKKKDDEGNVKELTDAVQEVVDETIEINDWNELEQELVRRSRRDGEYILRNFPEEDGTLHVRTVEPDQLTEAALDGGPHPESIRFGIRHLVEVDRETGHKFRDVQTVRGYGIKYDGEDDGEEVDPEYITHCKVNVDRAVKRGLSDFYATRPLLELCRKLLRNMGEGDAVRAAIAGIWQYDGTSSTAAQAHVNTIKDTGRSPPQNSVTGKTPNYQKIDPGTFVHAPKNKTFIPPPVSQAIAGNVQTVQALLRTVGTRWRMAEYMVSADASNNAYASSLVAGAPFVRFMIRQQGFYKRSFLRTLWSAVRFAFAAGRFDRFGVSWGQLRKLVEIQAEAPKPEIVNELENANRYQIERMNGVLSVQTWQQQIGLDPEQEMANNKTYLEETGGASLVTPEPKDHPGPEFEIGPDGEPVAVKPGPPEGGPPGVPPGAAKESRPLSESHSIATLAAVDVKRVELEERLGREAAIAVVGAAARLLGGSRVLSEAESYFATCPRDDKGHYDSSGGSGGSGGGSPREKMGEAKESIPPSQCETGKCQCEGCRAKALALKEQAGPTLDGFPDERQDSGWACGAACCAAIMRHFGKEPDTEAEAIRALGSSPRDGTDPEHLVQVLQNAGLETTSVSGMGMDDLEWYVGKGRPVVVAYQAWGTPDEVERLESGHYAVAVAVTPEFVEMMDPARFAEGEEVAEYGGMQLGPGQKVAVPRAEFERRWIDVDAEGRKYVRHGICVRSPVE